MDYEKLLNTNKDFLNLMNINEEALNQEKEIDANLKNLKQNITFLNDLLNSYDKEP